MALSPLAVFLQESSNTNDFFRNLAIQQELKDEWVLLDREIWVSHFLLLWFCWFETNFLEGLVAWCCGQCSIHKLR